MCMLYTDVTQVPNAARNYEILHERDDDDTERPDKRRVVIDISRPLSRVVTGATVIITTVMGLTGEADKKPGATGRVFAITEGHAANTSGTIAGTLFIYGHAVFVLFDTGATHSVISST
nr:reverse transcriptase domain-containing protein [Tanacetum cinerariifolium]GFC48272.1 reverse transcriptase domain-containing protein [Tanacetum cinerariifolium]GFC48292.1 reverse transcriptase domain-containing protein [Tanacetum cinerariifolium]